MWSERSAAVRGSDEANSAGNPLLPCLIGGIMQANSLFRDLIAKEGLGLISAEAIPDMYREVLLGGWMQDEEGAWLLEYFRSRHHASRSMFVDVAGYEASVNGRGIPDVDLPDGGTLRAVTLSRRGYVFAQAALRKLGSIPGHPAMKAYILICSTGECSDSDRYTGTVTFASSRRGQAGYLDDVEEITDCAVLVVDISDCTP